MTNKNIELAELLGIKPNYIVNFKLTFDKVLFEKGIVGEVIEDSEPIYPDFTKPDNFVKLLSSSYRDEVGQQYGVAGFLSKFIDLAEPITILLQLIQLYLPSDKSMYDLSDKDRLTLSQIKTALQQIEWSY